MARYDYSATGWQVGHELSDNRLIVDGLEAELFFVLMGRRVHGLKFDYSKTKFRSMKSPVTITKDGVDFTTTAFLHLFSSDGGYDGV